MVRFRAGELLPESDPRQLAFPIDGRQEEPDDSHTRPPPSPFARKRRIGRKATIYEKSD